jgi:hypothetical protein
MFPKTKDPGRKFTTSGEDRSGDLTSEVEEGNRASRHDVHLRD